MARTFYSVLQEGQISKGEASPPKPGAEMQFLIITMEMRLKRETYCNGIGSEKPVSRKTRQGKVAKNAKKSLFFTCGMGILICFRIVRQ